MGRLANRQIRLKADRQAPSVARAVIQDVLSETDLTDLCDDAVLLTTELTTNAVLHAGTDIELKIDVGEAGLRVSVCDGRRGELPVVDIMNMLAHPLSAGGRGLSLVDQIADAWGTTHDKSGKSVWFELTRRALDVADFPDSAILDSANLDSANPQRATSVGPRVPSRPGPGDFPPTVRWHVPPGDTRTDDRTTRVLRQLVALAGVKGARLRVDRADGYGEQTLAWCGDPEAGDERLQVAVPLGQPWRGELSVYAFEGWPLGGSLSHARQLAELCAGSIGLMLDNDRLRAADLRRRASLTFTVEASDLLAQSLDIELTTALIPRLIVPRLGEWCAVYRFDDDQLTLAAATHADEPATAALLAALDEPANRHVLRDAVNPGRHLTLSTACDGIAVPLTVRDRRLGVLAVGRPEGRRHDGEELAMIVDLAHRAGLAIDNARLHAERRRVADTLQQALLPPALPNVDGMRFAAEYIPAIGAAEVGGDFYDVLPLPDDRLMMVIGDVAGKGVAAATVTGLVRNVIRILAREGRSVPEILCRINETLLERGGGRFATLAVAVVRPDGPGLDVRLCLAGHDRPVLVRTDGGTEAIGECGTALGLLNTIRTREVSASVAPGDTLVFFTDGVTERRRGADFFGIDRVHAALAPLAGHDADIVVARLRAATLGFSAEPPRDDIAILALRNEHAVVRPGVHPVTPAAAQPARP